jgi:hypothetical protein
LRPSKRRGRSAFFVAHDLDADNRALLAARRIGFVLHHDLRSDARSAFRTDHEPRRCPGRIAPASLSAVEIITPYNMPSARWRFGFPLPAKSRYGLQLDERGECGMEYSDIGTVAAWLTEQGLKGASESELLTGFCNTCREFGLPLDRGMALMDTLHPVHEGRAFRWDSQEEVEDEFEYGPTGAREFAGELAESAFYYLWAGNENEVRRRIGFGDPIDFAMLEKMRTAGHTDLSLWCIALPRRERSGRWIASSRISRHAIRKAFPITI